MQHALAEPWPRTNLVVDANHWFQLRLGGAPRPYGKRGRVRRFRFGLMTDVPAELSTPSGKLSDEVWISVNQHRLCLPRADL